jgi:hypothetical protein
MVPLELVICTGVVPRTGLLAAGVERGGGRGEVVWMDGVVTSCGVVRGESSGEGFVGVVWGDPG